jgi:hypothetical protein
MTLRIRRIDESERVAVGRVLAELDRLARYPLGDDFFRIDHGANYFAFFRRLAARGEYRALSTWIATHDDTIVGTLTAVTRSLPSGQRASYVGDLKVRDSAAGSGVGLQLARAFVTESLRSFPHAYAVSMNPASGENRVARMLTRGGAIRAVATLVLFSLDAGEAARAVQALEPQVGKVSWLSLRGTKDIVLESTGAPLDLLHAQFGPFATHTGPGTIHTPREGAKHMFCAVEGSAVAIAARSIGLEPNATATLLATPSITAEVAHDGFVLTSEI